MIRLATIVALVSLSWGYPEKPVSSQYTPPIQPSPPQSPYVITAPMPIPEPSPATGSGSAQSPQYGPPPPPPSQYGAPLPPVPQPPPTQYGAPTSPPGENTPKPQVVCDTGLLPDPYGNCVEPEVVRDLYVFQEPADEEEGGAYQEPLPPPQVKLNLVVIRTNDGNEGDGPIIIPPPQEKTLVLVLSKKGDPGKQIIEIPAREGQKPEVFFVDYAEGDNTMLPGGIYLQDALQYAASAPGESSSGPGSQGSSGSTGGEFQPLPYYN